MMKSLRKRHLQIWTLWASLLPIGILGAWLYAPNTPHIKLLKLVRPALLPIIVSSKEAETFAVNIRSNQLGTEWQLEWQNRAALTVPSAVIYKRIDSVTTISKNELVGRIEARGNYVFPLTRAGGINEITFFVYDFIHNVTIDSLKFRL